MAGINPDRYFSQVMNRVILIYKKERPDKTDRRNVERTNKYVMQKVYYKYNNPHIQPGLTSGQAKEPINKLFL